MLSEEQQEEAISINEFLGWDSFIEYIETMSTDKYLKQQCENYWKGYDYIENDDCDDGKCFEMRYNAIQHILNTFTIDW